MLIRKTENAAGIIGRVLNNKNNGQADAYSCQYINDNKQDKLEVETISTSDFFESTNYDIDQFYAYKVGNIVNIQRMIVNGLNNLSANTNIGTVKSKYRPKANQYIRSGGMLMNNNVNYEGADIVIHGQTGLLRLANNSTSNSGNWYPYSIIYICKDE